MFSQIPGHVRAYTWALMLVGGATRYITTGRWMSVAGALIVIAGEFLGNQSTHLAQENHSGARMTWLENQQQLHTRPFQVLGLLVVALGFWLV